MNPPLPVVELKLSGPAWVRTAAGLRVELPERDAAMLAWLAVQGPQPRTRVLALLWPGDDEAAARNRLRQRVFSLRKLCGHPLLEGQVTLALRADVRHDLADAATLLGSQVWPELTEFSRWLDAERQRRQARQHARLNEQLAAHEHHHQWEAALATAEDLLRLDPLAEDVHRHVMQLHERRGDRAAAMLAFDRCAALLKDELGVAPSDETLLWLHSLQQDSPAAPSPISNQVPPSVLRPPLLVGRADDWAWLSARGPGAPVGWLGADGGVGKSRLLADFAAAQRKAGRRVLLVGARPGDAGVPCALLSRLLRAALAETGVQPSGALRAELSRVLPELCEPGVPATAAHTTRFVNAVLATVQQAAQQGLQAVMVDDLHLADEGSIEVLSPLCAGVPLPWTLAMRESELPARALAWRKELQRAGQADVRHLAPLTAHQVEALVESLALPGVDGHLWAEALHRRTGGNPLYLLECIKVLLSQPGSSEPLALAQLPATSQLIALRLSRLSPAALRLARCAAVAGPDFGIAMASAVLQAGPLDLADAWHELEAAQMLRDGAFAHDLIYEAALASVPTPIARELHLAMAVWLEAQQGEAARIAAHWLEGGDALRAAPALLNAAAAATARLQWQEGAALCERAAAISEQAGQADEAFDAYFKAVETHSYSGGAKRFAHLGAKLQALAHTDAQRAMSGLVVANIEGDAGRLANAELSARESLEPARREGLVEIESELEYTLGVFCWERRDVLGALHHVERALALLRAASPESCRLDYASTLLYRLSALGPILSAAGRIAEAARRLQEAWQTGVTYQRPTVLLTSANALANTLAQQGNLDQAQAWVERAALLCSEGEANDVDLTNAVDVRAQVRSLSGQWGAALEAHERVAERLQSHPARVQGYMHAGRAAFYFELGRRDLAFKTVQTGLDSSGDIKAQALALNAVQARAGGLMQTAELLAQVAALDDVALRARLLVQLAPVCDSAQALPVLMQTCAALREGGGLGLWLSLEARATAHLARLGRTDEAAARAQAAWQQREEGTSPASSWADCAADLAGALKMAQPDLARQIAQDGQAWLQQAAATLPAMWRDNCLARSPIRAVLPG